MTKAPSTVNRTKFFIGTTAAAETLQAFEADTYTQIKGVHDLGEFGDQFNPIEYAYVEEARNRRFKGMVDGGVLDLIVNRLAADAGQIKLVEASKFDSGDDDVNFKMILPDKATPNGDGSTIYFRATVMGGRTSFGEGDNVIRTTWSIAINTEWLEVEPD